MTEKPTSAITGGVYGTRFRESVRRLKGAKFEECYAERVSEDWDDVSVNIISLSKLKDNKRASGRLKDLNDLEHLE